MSVIANCYKQIIHLYNKYSGRYLHFPYKRFYIYFSVLLAICSSPFIVLVY